MNIARIRLLVLTAALLLAAGTVSAAEEFRGQLHTFVDQLGAIPQLGVDTSGARAAIDALTPEQLRSVQAAMAALPNWQELPEVVSAVDTARREHNRELLARYLAAGGGAGAPVLTDADQLEYFRSDFLFYLDQLERYAPMMSPEYTARIQAIRGIVRDLPPEGLPELRNAYEDFVAGLSGAKSDKFQPRTNCSDLDIECHVNEAVNEVKEELKKVQKELDKLKDNVSGFFDSFFDSTLPTLIAKVGALPGQVAVSFDSVFNGTKAFVYDQLAFVTHDLPTSVAAGLDVVGIDWDSVDWTRIASRVPNISAPCPQQAVEIAAEACSRGADALTELVYELAPDDGLSLAFKMSVAMVHYPLTYLCQCQDIQDAIAFADEEQAHREWTGTRLDLRLSTRATQASIDVLRGSVGVLDSDVAKVEAKLDTIGATTSRIEGNVARIESTVRRIESNVDRTERTSNSSERKIDALITGNDTQQELVEDFTTLMKRLSIEENLLHNRPDAVALFQLPAAFGGNLETVGLIVADTIRMNLAASQTISGAERELQRGDALRAAGDFVKAYEAYRSAYTESVK